MFKTNGLRKEKRSLCFAEILFKT